MTFIGAAVLILLVLLSIGWQPGITAANDLKILRMALCL
jgi:hypothetical protein